MSRFIGGKYPSLTHFFGLSAMQRLEKKIPSKYIFDMEVAFTEGVLENIRSKAVVDGIGQVLF